MKETILEKLKDEKVKKTISIALKVMVIFGVVIIPLLYSYFYLGAFWDPYSRLEDIPIAVVNLDAGAEINGEQRNVGEEVCQNLKENGTFKFVFTDLADAQSGVEGDEYYAAIEFPSDFSTCIASASGETKTTAKMIYTVNEKRNYITSQITSNVMPRIEKTISGSINSGIVMELSDKLQGIPSSLGELSDGLSQLSDGSSKLLAGSKSLSSGAGTLDEGIQKLLDGITTVNGKTANMDQLISGVAQLKSGSEEFNTGLKKYVDGVNKVTLSFEASVLLLQQCSPCLTTHPAVKVAVDTYLAAMNTSSNRADLKTLKESGTKLTDASQQITDGIAKLDSGVTDLPKLVEGLKQIQAGLESAKAGSAALSDGGLQLVSGASQLNSGINTASVGVGNSITDAESQMAALEGLDTFSNQPISSETVKVDEVDNYGTAFAPYFLSLSLWVGALMIFFGIYFDKETFNIMSQKSKKSFTRLLMYFGITLSQSLVLAFVIHKLVGLEANNLILYYVSCVIIGFSFLSIVQFFIMHFGHIGKFCTLFVLILQLTSCAGTFPLETIPKFFQFLYPFMPMTYSVGLLKEAISGSFGWAAIKNIIVLLLIFAVFISLTSWLNIVKRRKAEELEEA